jgi:ribonucleoside-triphosphate reductase (formate)
LASCCRLKNSIKNTFEYTLGGGLGVSTGSKNVITLNLNRLIQKKANLEEEIDKVHKYQIAFETYFRNLKENHMLPVYDAHYISMEKQYLTLGINGIVEAAEFLGYKISYNKEYVTFLKNILETFSKRNSIAGEYYSKLYGHKIMFNTELVPAESLGIKNAEWDKADGLKVNRDCYNSYLYIVEDDDLNILDKFKLYGKEIIKYMDGGSALHCNLESYPTEGTFRKLLDVAAQLGTNYFTFNIKNTCCEDCGFIDKRTLDHCSKCGSKNITWATRVIGYIKKITSWSQARQKEEKKRYYHKNSDS